MAPEDRAPFTDALLRQLAGTLRFRLDAERTARLTPAVEGMTAFTAELDEIVTPATLPAAVFIVEED